MTVREGQGLRPVKAPASVEEIIGRDEEIRQLLAAVEGLPESGSSILIHGEAGIGKTVLLQAAAVHAGTRGHQVLTATGLESETDLPFAGLRNLLSPVLHGLGSLPAPQRRALLAAFGEVVTGEPPQPFLIALATLNLVSDATVSGPIVLAVDDAQWLDPPTHDALAFVARRIAGEPVTLIVTWRDGHEGALLDAGLNSIALGGLTDRSARELLERHGPDLPVSDRDRILQHALGNPLALVELPAARRSAGDPEGDLSTSALPLSARLERAFASRLTELPNKTRHLLLVAAVNSENSIQEALAAAQSLAGEAVGVDAFVPATDAGLVSHDQEQVHFRHPLVRSGILQSESLHRRHAAHQALAAVLVDEPYRSTWHRAQGTIGKDDLLADELEYNHTISIRRGSVPAAIAALERSAQLTSDTAVRGRRLLLAAEHAFGLGRADMVDRLLRAAARNTLTDLERARMEWLREIFNDGVPGDATRVLELCEIARRAAAEDDTNLALNLLLGAALRCWWANAGAEASRFVVRVADELRDVEHDVRFTAILAVAQPNSESPRVQRRLRATVIERVTDPEELRLLGMAAHACGDPVLAVDLLDRAETRLRQQGRLGLLSHVLTMAILDRIDIGDLPRARAAIEEGRRIARETGQPIWDIGNLSIRAMLAGVEGATEEAHAAAAEAEQMANGRRLNDLLSCVQLARGFAYCSSGQYAEAYSALRRIFDAADPAFQETERLRGIMYLAEAATHSGNEEDARRIIADLHDLNEQTDVPLLRMQLLYADAVLADDADAEGLFHAALKEDLVRWPLLKARLELALGTWLRRQRRVTESRIPLRSAQVAFEVIGATAWGEQARAELRAAGLRPSDQMGHSPREVLSAQEFQIAELVAQGLSNRDIGEHLYLSPRTIGSHLYRMFPKLGVTSRAQLAAVLSGTGGPRDHADLLDEV
jgi:DNA-binding CsgD family transcriptional regulator